jgi:hypothetical protein
MPHNKSERREVWMASTQRAKRNGYLLDGRRVAVADLIEADYLKPDTRVVFAQPRIGKMHEATIRADGKIELADGRAFNSLSRAAGVAAGGSFDGWHAWKLAESGIFLDALRQELLDEAARTEKEPDTDG